MTNYFSEESDNVFLDPQGLKEASNGDHVVVSVIENSSYGSNFAVGQVNSYFCSLSFRFEKKYLLLHLFIYHIYLSHLFITFIYHIYLLLHITYSYLFLSS